MRRLKINSSISAHELPDDKDLFPFIDNFIILDGSTSVDAENGIFRKRDTISTGATVSIDTGQITDVGYIIIKILWGRCNVGVSGAMFIQLGGIYSPTCLFHSNDNDLLIHNPSTLVDADVEYLIFESV